MSHQKKDKPAPAPTRRLVIAEADEVTLIELAGLYRTQLAWGLSKMAEREARIKLGAVEHIMRERGLID